MKEYVCGFFMQKARLDTNIRRMKKLQIGNVVKSKEDEKEEKWETPTNTRICHKAKGGNIPKH